MRCDLLDFSEQSIINSIYSTLPQSPPSWASAMGSVSISTSNSISTSTGFVPVIGSISIMAFLSTSNSMFSSNAMITLLHDSFYCSLIFLALISELMLSTYISSTFDPSRSLSIITERPQTRGLAGPHMVMKMEDK